MGEMMGVRLGGGGSVKASEFRRGDENRPQRWILASSRVDGAAVPGSLSEGAAERSEAEGVSFVGCFWQMVYHAAPLALTFLSGYVHRGTLPQSASLTAPSGREPGTAGLHHSTGYSLKSGVTGDFHRPYGGRVPFIVPPGNRKVSGDFHRPYEGSGNFSFCHSTGCLRNRGGRGIFIARRAFAVHWGCCLG